MKLKWLVELEVDETWIADGFDLTDERAKDMLAKDLQYAHGTELSAKVIKAPDPKVIRKLQGYEDQDLIQAMITRRLRLGSNLEIGGEYYGE